MLLQAQDSARALTLTLSAKHVVKVELYPKGEGEREAYTLEDVVHPVPLLAHFTRLVVFWAFHQQMSVQLFKTATWSSVYTFSR